MFPELERKIESARNSRSPSVVPLLCALSKAEKAQWSGNEQRAEILVKHAMKL